MNIVKREEQQRRNQVNMSQSCGQMHKSLLFLFSLYSCNKKHHQKTKASSNSENRNLEILILQGWRYDTVSHTSNFNYMSYVIKFLCPHFNKSLLLHVVSPHLLVKNQIWNLSLFPTIFRDEGPLPTKTYQTNLRKANNNQCRLLCRTQFFFIYGVY